MIGATVLGLTWACGGSDEAPTPAAPTSDQAEAPQKPKHEKVPNPSREPTQADLVELAAIYEAEQELLETARKMERIRKPGPGQDLEACARLMRESLPVAEDLDERAAAKLPLAHAKMAAAVGHMKQCVTCNQETAFFHCKEASGLMKEVKAELLDAVD